MKQFCILLALSVVLGTPAARAEDTPATLRVATRIVPPLVVKDHGRLTGFSIDLWNALASELKVKSEFIETGDVTSLLDLIKTGKADVGIAGISITSDRDKTFDFSQPMLNAGLQILVRGEGASPQSNPLMGLLRLLVSPMILIWLGIAFLLILIPAHVVWYLEKDKDDGIIRHRSYLPGIFDAMWWAAGTLATQADQMPRHWLARLVAVLWMFTSVVFVAYYTAQLTASLTVEQIRGDINGPDDLAGKRVATTKGSTAAGFLKEARARVQEFETIGEAYQALLSKEADAVVFDAPVVLSYAEHEGKGRVQTVGTIFRKEDYGIVFAEDNPLRKRVDGALLLLRENGTYEQIYEKWFGHAG